MILPAWDKIWHSCWMYNYHPITRNHIRASNKGTFAMLSGQRLSLPAAPRVNSGPTENALSDLRQQNSDMEREVV
jgi:hypothetical protein